MFLCVALARAMAGPHSMRVRVAAYVHVCAKILAVF